jgi:uncharacterized protein (UPF0248 family)
VAKKKRPTARDVLNELKWREGRSLATAEIWFADRMRPEGYRIIEGDEITGLGRGYFSLGDSMLPYYKILRIVCEGEVVFDRPEGERKTAK